MVMLYLGNYLSCQVEEPKVSVKMETMQINDDARKRGFSQPLRKENGKSHFVML
jgi:hypothetical protein